MQKTLFALLSVVLVTAVPGPIAGAQDDLHLNRTFETLAAGKPAFGIFSGDFSLANARALAASDLDFVFIDMKHSPFDLETLQAFLLGMTDKKRDIPCGLTTCASDVESYLDEGYRFVTVGYWNDAGISGGVAEAPDLARKASGRDNE